jgi:hypothetical protein
MTTMMVETQSAHELVRVPFNGDELWAVKKDGKVWVSLRRCCEMMGLKADAQRAKLANESRCPWAKSRTSIMDVRDTKGQPQQAFMIERGGLPMWLATIAPGKVRPEVRPMLIKFQDEAADVLAKHFFGTRPVEKLWSVRFAPALEHRREVNHRHPGWWSVVTELILDFTTIQDVLFLAGYPTRVEDQPDGSAGQLFADYRKGKPWAGPTFKDCPLLLPPGDVCKVSRVVHPHVYSRAEHHHFREFFETIYAVEHLPKYLANKAKRDKQVWSDHGFPALTQTDLGVALRGAVARVAGLGAAAMIRFHSQGELNF